MDTKFQTSFIPKKTAPASAGRPISGSVSPFMLGAIIIFVLTLAASGAVFAYRRILISSIGDMDRRLVEAKNSFEPDFINKVDRLNKRIEAAKKLIVAHKVVSPIFEVLENNTLATVRFNDFSYNLKDGGESSISLSGEAKNFSSVALQSDIFGKEKYIKSPAFSDLNPDSSGNIVFKFNASIDPALTSYQKNISLAKTAGTGQ
jgi:hypothetical protein